ncbi:MAG: proline--tRNA ligase, partial [Thermoplasmatales archaeon]
AEKQIEEDKEIAHRLFNKLSLPFILSKRPEWDKFAGAFYTISIDVLMPSYRTLQLGSIHQYKDNFSKPYEISYEAEDGKHSYCHQTTYGMSERILGALVGIHGDDKGLVMPPEVAPVQVVLIPIIFKGEEKTVLEACDNLNLKLSEEGIKSYVDKRDINPGNKFYDWELKGVPLRVEIGPKDIKNNQVVVVRRDTSEKQSISNDSAVSIIKEEINKISKSLYDKAKKLLDENINRVNTIDEAKNLKGIVELPWCGTEDCALEIENILDGNTLGEPIQDNECNIPCPVCNKPGTTWMRYAKSY